MAEAKVGNYRLVMAGLVRHKAGHDELSPALRLRRYGGVGGKGAAQVCGIDRDRDAGALLLQQHGGTRVALVPAAVARLRHFLEREIAQPHRHAELAAERDRERHVLVGEAERERGRVVDARQELVDQRIEGAAASDRALADRLEQFLPGVY